MHYTSSLSVKGLYISIDKKRIPEVTKVCKIIEQKNMGLKPLEFQALWDWPWCRDLNPGPLGNEGRP